MSGSAPGRRLLGKILLKRLSVLLANVKGTYAYPVSKRGISRAWVAEKIGCKAATLSSNHDLKQMLNEFDTSMPRQPLHRAALDAEIENVVLLKPPSLFERGKIFRVDFSVNGRTFSIPVLIWSDGLDVEVNDYLRYLLVKRKKEPSSVEEVAKKLRQFVRYMRSKKIRFERVDDEVLLSFQSTLAACGAKMQRRNALLRTVHSYYIWLEEAGHVRHQVQIGRSEAGTNFYEYPISSQEIQVRTAKGRTRTSWVWPFLETSSAKRPHRHTPTYSEIERIYDLADRQKYGTRNVLLMNWALKTGGRLSEILSVKLEDLPWTDAQRRQMIEDDRWIITLPRRKNRPEGGYLRAPADLIWETLLYVETERKRLAVNGPSTSLGPIFLSERGTPIVADSVTHICTLLFRAAKVDRANIHRLRARFAHDAVELTLLSLKEVGIQLDSSSGWHETALTMAAELMGHSSARSLEPYLHDILFRWSEEARLQRERPDFQPAPKNPLHNEEILGAMAKATIHLQNGDELSARTILRRVAGEIDRRRLYA